MNSYLNTKRIIVRGDVQGEDSGWRCNRTGIDRQPREGVGERVVMAEPKVSARLPRLMEWQVKM